MLSLKLSTTETSRPSNPPIIVWCLLAPLSFSPVNYTSAYQPANIFATGRRNLARCFHACFLHCKSLLQGIFSEGLIVLMCSIYGEIFLLDKDDNFYLAEQFKFFPWNCPIKSLCCWVWWSISRHHHFLYIKIMIIEFWKLLPWNVIWSRIVAYWKLPQPVGHLVWGSDCQIMWGRGDLYEVWAGTKILVGRRRYPELLVLIILPTGQIQVSCNELWSDYYWTVCWRVLCCWW